MIEGDGVGSGSCLSGEGGDQSVLDKVGGKRPHCARTYSFLIFSLKKKKDGNFSNTCGTSIHVLRAGGLQEPAVSSLHKRDYILTHCWRGPPSWPAASCSVTNNGASDIIKVSEVKTR